MGFALIERYIFRKALISVLSAGAGLIGVLWVVRAVQQVDVLLSKGQGIITYLKMTTLGIPTLTAAIAPMALLIGLIQTINALNDDSELVVMHASGASRVSLLKPFLLLSLLVTGFVFFLNLWAGPTSMQTLRTYVTKVRADLVSVVVQEGRFQDVGQGLTFHVESRAPGGLLNGVFIFDGRNKKEHFTYLAKEGVVTKVDGNTYLVLQQGQIQRQTLATDDLSTIKFNSYAFNLSSFSGGTTAKTVSQNEVPTSELLNPDKESWLYKRAPERYFAELHIRLTGGLYPLMVGLLVLAFLGNPNSHRQSQGVVITAACTVILCIRGATIVAEGAMRKDPSMAFVTWGLPLAAILTSIALLAADKSAFSPEMLARTETLLGKIGHKLEPWRAKIFGQRPAVEAHA